MDRRWPGSPKTRVVTGDRAMVLGLCKDIGDRHSRQGEIVVTLGAGVCGIPCKPSAQHGQGGEMIIGGDSTRHRSRAPFVAIILTWMGVASLGAGAVNLEFRPESQVVPTDGIAEVGLYAATTSGTQSISALEAIVSWNPAKLELLGIVNNGPYNWLSSSFPNDSNQDGLNAPFTGLPANDGSAWYNALSRFPPNPTAVATPQGLLVTTFRFRYLNAGASEVRLLPQAGSSTQTQVWSGDVPGLVITGTLGPPVDVQPVGFVPVVSAWSLQVTTVLLMSLGVVVFGNRAKCGVSLGFVQA